MSSGAASVLPPAIATLALSLFLLSLTMPTGPVAAATACKTAPTRSAPEGSHWYYRTDRATQRKCWYLAAEGQKVLKGAPRVASRTPAAAQPASMEEGGERLMRLAELRSAGPAAEAQPLQPPPAPVEQAGPEPTPVVQALAPVVTSSDRIEVPASMSGGEQPVAQGILNSGPPDERAVQPPVYAGDIAHVLAGTNAGTLWFALLALAASCLLASSILYLAGAKRRRAVVQQVHIVDLNTKALSRVPAKVERRRPRPAPADALDHEQLAAVEERLRQFSQAWRQQAA